MFNPFQEIRKGEARTFSSLPGKFRKKGRTAWSDPNRAGAPVDSFLEGPSFDRDGNLWCVDIPFGRIFRIDPKGEWELAAQYDGWPNGLKIHRDGRIFIADYRRGLVPLVVPLTLLGHHVRRQDVSYLAEQVYLSPHPKELMLRNHV